MFSIDNFSFTDYSASEGIVHEYCVVSVGECGESEQSCNTGYRKTEPNIVESTDASDGLFEDYVLITWESSENTDYYKVYRDEAWIALINPNSELEFIDEYIDPEKVLFPEENAGIESLKEKIKLYDIFDSDHSKGLLLKFSANLSAFSASSL